MDTGLRRYKLPVDCSMILKTASFNTLLLPKLTACLV